MDLKAQRDLQLLTEVERSSGITQRDLAERLGVALGLTNLYLKRLARKGYIKITTIPRNRIKYLLTPRGIAEKSRLTYLYMQYSLSYYRDMRNRLRVALREISKNGAKRLIIYGTGELAELAYISLRETDLTLIGFISWNNRGSFLSCPLWPMEAARNLEFDTLLIAELIEADNVLDKLTHLGVPRGKILSLGPLQGLAV